MNILLVYPETPSTFYSFRHALRFISKKSDGPPIGLLTVAAMLPGDWGKKLVDLNVTSLTPDHLDWADYVFLSGMNVQKNSFKEVIRRCNQAGVTVVAGGPMATSEPEEFPGIDHFVLNEAEITLAPFLEDIRHGRPQHMYTSDQFPDITRTPTPMWDLLNMKDYATMYVQYSRGCPFNCEFCSITMLNGRHPRTKGCAQFIGELESLYQRGWRGGVFIVDDNFIGNKVKLKTELLPALIDWSETRGFPFEFNTEASINIADDEELVRLMFGAGFRSIFVGIETPNEDSLAECGKLQNRGRDLVSSVEVLQRNGLRVAAGFIIGFDSDTPGIFQRQIDFIQKSGIVSAMVGLLNAPRGTALFQRMKSENRLVGGPTGDNMDGSTNLIPKMGYQQLIKGYKEVLETIYDPKVYYERIKTLLEQYPAGISIKRIRMVDVKAFLRSLWQLGLIEKGRRYYWKLLFLSTFKYPGKLSLAMTMAVYGSHFRRIVAMV
jgi:radical SAM superfamily enzyme YgiQ (UPF0313 family)